MVSSARRPLRQALAGSSLLFAAMMVVNALNYGYALVLGRFFGPAEYGAYASFMSLFLLVSLLPMTLQQVGAKYAAAGSSVVAYTARLGLGLGGAAGLALVLTAGPLGGLIRLPPAWLVGLGVTLPFFALLGCLRGEAQGRQAFAPLGVNLVLEHAVKIVLTPLALLAAPLAAGAVLATLSALPMTLAHVWRYLKTRALGAVDRAAVRRYALPILANLAAQALIINSDVLMVNALLSTEEAGVYAAIALIGRVVFYGSWAISAAVFPMVAARHGAGRPHGDLLALALGGVALVSLGITALCALAPGLVIGLLFGEAYLVGVALVAPYALMTTLYALANVVSSHYLALGSHRAGYLPLVGAAGQIALVLTLHDTSLQVIYAQIAAKGGLLALLLAAAALGWLSKGEKHVVR